MYIQENGVSDGHRYNNANESDKKVTRMNQLAKDAREWQFVYRLLVTLLRLRIIEQNSVSISEYIQRVNNESFS